jgi:hypothetical protein
MEQIPKELLIVMDLRQFGAHPRVEFMRVLRPRLVNCPHFNQLPLRLGGSRSA